MRRLWIEEPMTEAEAALLVTPEEREAARAFSERRRREWLAWRAIVRRELGSEVCITYSEAGAPIVGLRGVHLSVSHCSGGVAVCISDAPCAVDIESETRDFSRAMPRYMTAAECALSDDPLLPAAVWSAKETLYKYAGRKELDLLRDLCIERADLRAGSLWGRICGGELLRLSFFRLSGRIVVCLF